jgi:hypothetical protein
MCVVHSELIRYLRICSHKVFYDANVKCLRQELKVAGYTDREVYAKIEEVKGRITGEDEEGGEVEEALESDDNIERIYGAKTEFNDVTRSHEVVKDTLRICLGKRKVGMPIVVPGKKVISYCYTKNMMQKKARNFLEIN